MKFVLQSILCAVICKFSEFYYNFVTMELEKLKLFHNFALQKGFFLKIRWIFILKQICILRKVEEVFFEL